MGKLKKTLLIMTATAVLAFNQLALYNAPQLTANAGQQLGMTDFDKGVGLPWHICESGPGKMKFKIENGYYEITIVNPGGASQGGEDRWDCQFRHRGLKIVAGRQYKVSYEITASNSGKYYTKIGNLEGDIEVWHNMSTNEGDFGGNWEPMQINANETKKVELTFIPSQSLDVAEWSFHLGGDGQYTPGGCFPAGTVIKFDNMSLIDLTGSDNDFIPIVPWQRADIITNQLSYFFDYNKKATMLCDGTKVIKYDIIDTSGKSVFSGTSKPFGYDKDSGDYVHIIDFSDFKQKGTYSIEAANGAKSRTFDIGKNEIYSSLLYDSLNYFYQNRSGIPIESKYITSGDADALARAAGHASDVAEIEQTWGYSGSSGTQDVTGGWYDAGDHGKYVVNGGISLWTLQNQYETALNYGYADAFTDGTMYLPESNNAYPDLLDEARYEMEWMFKMLVQGGEYDGMAYHKIHDEKWTALAIAPADDDFKRIIKPPTTAATLNVAACAAQAARLWKGIDPIFASQCLETAKKAYSAAKKHPTMYAPLDQAIGGGAYGDNNATDEFYWAASELFITTGDSAYYSDIKSSPYFLKLSTNMGEGEHVDTPASFDWGNVSALGTLSLALNESKLSTDDYKTAKNNIVTASEYFINLADKQGYGLPYGQSTIGYNDSDKGYIWGSNSAVANNSIVMAHAYYLSGDTKHINGAISGMDYLLGRNAMDYSYVTGYGTHTAEYPHHRWWSAQIDATFPKAPCGVLVGGPNSGMQDPWVQGYGWKKGEIAPQKAYLDHIEAWSVNECTINWNAPLAWLTGFLASENGGIVAGSTGSLSGRINNGGDGQPNEAADYDSDDSVRETSESKAEDKGGSGVTDSSGLAKIAIIAGAVVTGLVATEIFVFKILKMKNGNSNPPKNLNQK